MHQLLHRLGRFTYRARYAVVGVFVLLMALSGWYGHDLAGRLTQEGWFNDDSESVAAAKLADRTFGRDTDGDIIALYTAPPGRTVDDIAPQMKAHLAGLSARYPEQIRKIDSYWDGLFASPFADDSRRHAFASIGLRGEGTTTVKNFDAVRDSIAAPGVETQLAGLQPLVAGINQGSQADIRRAEMIALPLVAILLYFVFGGVIAALLPVLVGAMTILGTQGVMRALASFIGVNAFASAVVTLVSLGLAIDYGLFTVTRFREELAAGRSAEDAIARTVATAGRTVLFSAAVIAISLGALLIYPIGVLRSVPYGGISAVLLAALASVTVLPALLAIIGPHIDALSWRRITHRQRTTDVDAGFFSRLALFALRRPWLVALPILAGLLLLMVPLRGVQFGGISERYLAIDDPARVAQQDFDRLFPQFRIEPLKLVVTGADNAQLSKIREEANAIPGLTGEFNASAPTKDGINAMHAGLADKRNAGPVIEELRRIQAPEGVRIMVTGVPALEYDSIRGLIDGLPLLVAILLASSLALLYAAFRSIILAIKAIVLSALSIGATIGILTWIFVDGHGAGLLYFTPGPLMFAALVLIATVVFGLSTDYEVFLLSRIVEAHDAGESAEESVRFGIAHTGSVITAAASILIVVTGAFGFSDLVLMKYIAFGMIAALILDATVIRMLLVPALLKLIWSRQ